MQTSPFSPLDNLPWIRWLDRTEIPSVVIGIAVIMLFAPFYSYNAMMPQMPFQGAAFPPALALALTFLLHLSRGAANDLKLLVMAEKIDSFHLESLAASKTAGRIELTIGLLIGFERVYAQIVYATRDGADLMSVLSPSAVLVCLSIIGYTVLQIHLLAFCVRQVVVFRRVAINFRVDLLTPELNNTLSNPLIRFLLVGLVGLSFGTLLYEIVPYASLQRRVLNGAFIAIVVWWVLLIVSVVPLFVLKSRIQVAKAMEINLVRRALQGDKSGIPHSQLGERLSEFGLADLMYYEDRIKNVWEWPFEAHVRRLVLFGLLPPLTWVLAAIVEILFESALVG